MWLSNQKDAPTSRRTGSSCEKKNTHGRCEDKLTYEAVPEGAQTLFGASPELSLIRRISKHFSQKRETYLHLMRLVKVGFQLTPA